MLRGHVLGCRWLGQCGYSRGYSLGFDYVLRSDQNRKHTVITNDAPTIHGSVHFLHFITILYTQRPTSGVIPSILAELHRNLAIINWILILFYKGLQPNH